MKNEKAIKITKEYLEEIRQNPKSALRKTGVKITNLPGLKKKYNTYRP